MNDLLQPSVRALSPVRALTSLTAMHAWLKHSPSGDCFLAMSQRTTLDAFVQFYQQRQLTRQELPSFAPTAEAPLQRAIEEQTGPTDFGTVPNTSQRKIASATDPYPGAHTWRERQRTH